MPETTCYSCGFMPICYVRRQFWEAILASGLLLDEHVHKQVFRVVAEGCKRYEYREEV